MRCGLIHVALMTEADRHLSKGASLAGMGAVIRTCLPNKGLTLLAALADLLPLSVTSLKMLCAVIRWVISAFS